MSEKKFDGNVVIELVVDNYNFGDVAEAITHKLYELHFVVASTVSRGGSK